MVELPQRRALYGLQLSASICLGLVAALAAMLWLIRRQLDLAFAPLNETACELARKSAADLSPVGAAGTPSELAPVLAAFNALLARVGAALRNEQRFTSDAAHELRTPLATLKLLAHNAQQARDDGERRDALAQMNRAIARSSSLIDQILALSRFDRDPSGLDLRQRFDLCALCERVVDELRGLAEDKQIEVRVRCATADGAWLVGNREAIVVTVRNLLHNALLYTPAAGRVEIEIHSDAPDAALELQVHDSGPGIAPALQQRVFARFFRVDPSGGTGSGLGLALVQRIVEIHGGSVAIETSARLGGTLVRVRWNAKC
jgi:two-component system, OmpR family, sensor kinase